MAVTDLYLIPPLRWDFTWRLAWLPHSTMWIDALQRKADEDSLVLQKMTGDWQNYSQALSGMKSNISSIAQTMRSLQTSLTADQQRVTMSNEMFYDLTQQVRGRWLMWREGVGVPLRLTLWIPSVAIQRFPLIMFFKEHVLCPDDEPADATGQCNDFHG